MGQSRLWSTTCLLLIVALAGCGGGGGGSAADTAEVERANQWLQRFQAEHPDKAAQYAQECVKEVGLGMTRESVLKLVGCMQKRNEAAAKS